MNREEGNLGGEGRGRKIVRGWIRGLNLNDWLQKLKGEWGTEVTFRRESKNIHKNKNNNLHRNGVDNYIDLQSFSHISKFGGYMKQEQKTFIRSEAVTMLRMI